MSFERITTDRTLDEMKAGHEIYQLVPADLSMQIAEWLTGEFVIEEGPQEARSDPPSSKHGKEKVLKVGTSKKRKTLDWGKIQALHEAGWPHAKIADEVGTTASTISTGLSRLRKDPQDGRPVPGQDVN